MKIQIISKPSQKLKYVDPNFDTEGVDQDDYESEESYQDIFDKY